MEEFAPLMMLGVRVREVRELDEGAIWCDECRILIVDLDLSPDEREEIACWALPRAMDRAA